MCAGVAFPSALCAGPTPSPLAGRWGYAQPVMHSCPHLLVDNLNCNAWVHIILWITYGQLNIMMIV